MKFISLKQKDIRVKHILPRDCGVTADENSTEIKEKCLKEAFNIILRDGYYKTRKGFYSEPQGLLDTSMCDGAEGYEYALTEAEATIAGKRRRIAYIKVKNDISNCLVFVFGISGDRDIISLGYLHFGRVTEDTFYCPEKILFYSGKKNGSETVFAMVGLKNTENAAEGYYAIYEAWENFSFWQQSSDFYTPTIYINGRGNAYETLEWSYSSKPQKPESLNLLDGGFYAYYSSDGASTGFRLPFTDIDDSTVICRIYSSLSEYTEWVIHQGTYSATKSFLGSEVTAYVNREKGMVYFLLNGSNFPIPIMNEYGENNIRIFAKKNMENAFGAIVSSSCYTSFGEKQLFSGGEEGNRIYYTEYDNPLYFPQVFDNEIGAADEAVTALKVFGGKLIAFKANEIYEIGIKNGGNFNRTALLADNGAFFKNADTFNIKLIDGETGCSDGKTAVICGNKLVWCSDNTVYSLKGGVGSAEKIISLNGNLNESNEIYSFSAAIGENYIFCGTQRAVIINTENSGAYNWSFPEGVSIKGVFSVGERLFFLYCYTDSTDCYMAELLGDKDIVIYSKGAKQRIKEFLIDSKFSLNCFNFEEIYPQKRITRVDLRLDCKGKSVITVGDGRVFTSYTVEAPFNTKNSKRKLKLIPDLLGAERVEISIKSNNVISFGGADIYYC